MTRNTKPPETVTFRASTVLQARIDALAAGHGGNRSKAIQAAILNAIEHEADDIPDEQEVLRLLGESARGGNVSAMKELRAYHRERDGDQTEADPLSSIDELAARRAA